MPLVQLQPAFDPFAAEALAEKHLATAPRGRELRAALDPCPRLVIETVHAHERAAWPAHWRFRGQREPASGQLVLRDRDRLAERLIVGDVPWPETELQSPPRSALEAVGDLIRLGRGFQQRDGD